MEYDNFKNVKLDSAVISEKPGVLLPHPEAGINILKFQLAKENFDDSHILFGNVTVGAMNKVLESAGTYIDHSLFMLGEIK